MTRTQAIRHTTVGAIRADVLAFTAGRDVELDAQLIEADCIGSAAHVVMLSEMPVRPRLFTAAERRRVIAELARILRRARAGRFAIAVEDQDVHLAVERALTERLGELGRKIHTARSRNDQVAVDLRLFARDQLLSVMDEALTLGATLLTWAAAHRLTPMVGRTHMQPAMPSSVGLWASAYAEGLAGDVRLVRAVYELNDECPLGSAAGYGVPLPINRHRVASLLGFRRPCHNVLAAASARGKLEAACGSALAQVMVTLSRFAQDVMLYAMPEFGYFRLPPEMGTGSSIMPQKNNPDVLELIRAKAARTIADAGAMLEIVRGLPSGYNRDVQETKEPFLRLIHETRASLRVLVPLVWGLDVNPEALRTGFTPGVFAADRALELAARGLPFRDAYHHVKHHLDELADMDPREAVARKTHWGAPAGLRLDLLRGRLAREAAFVRAEQQRCRRTIARLLRMPF